MNESHNVVWLDIGETKKESDYALGHKIYAGLVNPIVVYTYISTSRYPQKCDNHCAEVVHSRWRLLSELGLGCLHLRPNNIANHIYLESSTTYQIRSRNRPYGKTCGVRLLLEKKMPVSLGKKRT